jgi:hypothetical protein
LDLFFDQNEFGVEAVITLTSGSTRKLSVIFQTPSQEVNIYDSSIEANTPNFLCQSADLEGARTGDTVVIDRRTYKIGRISDDGTGSSTVYLKT